MSDNQDMIFTGEITEALKGGVFRVELENGHEVLAHVGGKLRRGRVRILLGDKVQVAVSAYDLSRGRITFRFK